MWEICSDGVKAVWPFTVTTAHKEHSMRQERLSKAFRAAEALNTTCREKEER